MAVINYEDIADIFINNLNIQDTVKALSSIFENERFKSKINYHPYFQRNYVWDNLKATYFIESIFLGTEIPPLVLFHNGISNEVIDGRQRYETILNFLNNEFILKDEGLKVLKILAGKKYDDLDPRLKDRFSEDNKLRILQCTVTNEPKLEEDKEDKIKKEIFKRYNSGITPLSKVDIERAIFIGDAITNYFDNSFDKDTTLYRKYCNLFLPKSLEKVQKRDKLNNLLSKLRTLLTLPFIPINNYANSSSKSDVVGKFYAFEIVKLDPKVKLEEFTEIIELLIAIKDYLYKINSSSLDNILLYECTFWLLSLLYKNNFEIFGSFDVIDFCKYIEAAKDKDIVFEKTGSHYHKAIVTRYRFVADYVAEKYGLNLDIYFKNTANFNNIINSNKGQIEFVNQNKLNKADPTSMTIEDILKKIKKSKFLIRPDYQRSEVGNTKKASYLMESIMLGIKIPPIFIYKRRDKKYEVVDGQQRLLSIIGFIGESYLNENGEFETSIKDKYKLIGLKMLKFLNGKDYGDLLNKYPTYVDKILEFQLNVVEIDAEQNPEFNSIDLFLRLNTKPYPIGENTFEMWNANAAKDIILKIKMIAEEYHKELFRPKDVRMKNEELITALAYIDYKKKINKSNARNVLDIYVRSGRINARLRKADITKALNEITSSTKEIELFLESVDEVYEFIRKIKILLNNNYDEVNKLFDHRKSSGMVRTDQNYYLLWILLDKFDIETVEAQKGALIKLISEVFMKVQNYPEEKTGGDFINYLDSISRDNLIN